LKEICKSYEYKKHRGQDFLEEKEYGREFLEEKEKDKEEYGQKEKEECAICLEEIELPISLECGHVFCVSCLIQYQATNIEEGTSCPNCRGDLDIRDTTKKSSDQMSVYIARANMLEGAEREVYVNLTLQQIEATLNNQSLFEEQEKKDFIQLGTLFKKAMALGDLNMPREVIDTVDEIMNLYAATDSDVDVEWILEARIAKAEAYLKLKEWQNALEMYTLLYEDCKEHHKKYCCAITIGISRAQYELQNYHEASLQGFRAAYRHNRYHVGVHKYIALSQMKMGDIAAAKKSITRGILHEEQWNEDNKKENEEVLRMILAEEAQNKKQKSKKKGKKKGRGKK